MNAAFELPAAPTTGARIRGVFRHGCARLAADAQITLVILRQVRQSVTAGVFPDLSPRPVGQRTHLCQRFPGRQTVQLGFFEVFSRDGLLPTQSREPDFKRLEHLEQRSHFAQLAASRRILAIKQTERRFLVLNALPGDYVDQVQSPITRELVAKFVSLRKVVPGLKEKHRNAGQALAQQVKNNDVFSLKAACKTGTFVWSLVQNYINDFVGGSRLEAVPIVWRAHFNPPSIRLRTACFGVFLRCRARDRKPARSPWTNLRPKDRSRIRGRVL